MLEKAWTERVSKDIGLNQRDSAYRQSYMRDYSRIIQSASFRRLQNKTQVIALDGNDFYRTRLTHSIEVAQIGSSLIEYLNYRYKNDDTIPHLLPDNFLLQTICLSHDIGHPPFGHTGEQALNYCMHKHGGFEANGQTLRILSFLDNYTHNNGMNLTRRSLLGTLKYPISFSEATKNTTYTNTNTNAHLPFYIGMKDFVPPKCYLDTEKNIVNWLLLPFNESDKKEMLTQLDYTLDASLMDLSDDISYNTHDLEDAINLQIITIEHWKTLDHPFAQRYERDLFIQDSTVRKNAISQMVYDFINHSYLKHNSNYSHPLLQYQLALEPEWDSFLKGLHQLLFKHMILHHKVRQTGFLSKKIIIELFSALQSDQAFLLPEAEFKKHQTAKSESEQMRIICDFIAGMSDKFARKIHQRLFDSKESNIFDKL